MKPRVNVSFVAELKNAKFTAVGIILSFALPCSVLAYDIKGLKIGSTEADVLAASPDATCKESMLSGSPTRLCIGDVSFAGAPATVFVTFMAGQADYVSVTFPSKTWPVVREAINAKYPTGSTTTSSVVQNRMGASFDQQEIVWVAGDVTMRAAKRSNDLTEGVVELLSQRGMVERAKAAEAAGRALSEDI